MKEIINTPYVYKNGELYATGNTVVTVVEDPVAIKLPPCAPCFPFVVNTRCINRNAFCDRLRCLLRCCR